MPSRDKVASMPRCAHLAISVASQPEDSIRTSTSAFVCVIGLDNPRDQRVAYLRTVIASNNVIRDVGEGIAVSVVKGARTTAINGNIISQDIINSYLY